MALTPMAPMPMSMPQMMPAAPMAGQLPPVMAQVLSSGPATASVGLDVNNDGRPDVYVTGEDRNRDGIPDSLEQPRARTVMSGRWAAGGAPQGQPMRLMSSQGAVPYGMQAQTMEMMQPAMSYAGPSYAVPSYAPGQEILQMASAQQVPYGMYQAPVPGTTAQSLSYVPPQVPQQLSYVPAPQMARGPSFVSPPMPGMMQVQQAPSFVAQPPPAQAPVEGTLTRGMPDPKAVDQQRSAYAKALDTELQKSIQAIQEKNAMEKKMLAQAAQQQKAMYELQVDQMVQGQSAMLDEQRNMQLLGLQQEAMNQKIGLENQAAGIKLEYEQRKAQEEMMFKQYELQKVYYDSERKMVMQQQEYANVQQQQASIPPAMPPPGAMFAMPPSVQAPAGLPQAPQGMMMMPGTMQMQMQQPMQMQASQLSMETVRSLPAQSMGVLPGAPPQMYEQMPPGYGVPLSYAAPAQTYQPGVPMTYMQQTPSYVGPPTLGA